MARKSIGLSQTEWLLMKICWDKGEVSARDIYDASLKEEQRTYGAVNTMLDRLVKKGYLERRKFGPIWLYKPAKSRAKEIKRAVEQFVATVVDNSFSPLISYFAGREKLSDEEIRQLKELIDKHEGK